MDHGPIESLNFSLVKGIHDGFMEILIAHKLSDDDKSEVGIQKYLFY